MSQLFAEVLTFLRGVPKARWGLLGVVLGVAATLFWVWRTNRANRERLVQQLKSDRELASREREMNLRKEVYGTLR
jgi:hypothetical protein